MKKTMKLTAQAKNKTLSPTGLRNWGGLLGRALAKHKNTKAVVTQRPRRLVAEQLEPRMMLSGEAMVLPPNQQQQDKTGVIDLSAAAAASMVQSAANAQISAAVNAPAVTSKVTNQVVNELIFVDAAVEDKNTLIAQALSGRDAAKAELIVLDSKTDGVEQITSWIKQYQNIEAVHIISHAEPESVDLGSAHLTTTTLSQYASDLAQWSNSLSDKADILFYGCSLTASDAGQSLITQIATLTGADVTASNDATGSAALGGNWTLETQTGAIEAQLLFNQQTNYSGLLADYTFASASVRSALLDTLGRLDATGNAALQDAVVNAELPGMATKSVNSLIGVAAASGSTTSLFDLQSQASTYFTTNGSSSTLVGLLAYLNANGTLQAKLDTINGSSVNWITGDYNATTNQVTLTLNFAKTKTDTSVAFALTPTLSQGGSVTTALTGVDVTSNISINLVAGINTTPTLASSYVKVNDLTLTATITDPSSYVGGDFTMQAGANFAIVDSNNTDQQGIITTTEFTDIANSKAIVATSTSINKVTSNSFTLTLNGVAYALNFDASTTTSNTSRTDLVSDLQAILTATSVTGALSPTYTHLGQLVTVSDNAGVLTLTMHAAVTTASLALDNDVNNKLATVLGFADTASMTTQKIVASSTSTFVVTDTEVFTLVLNGESYSLGFNTATTYTNSNRSDLVADLQAILTNQAVSANGILAYLGFSNLGQVVTFSDDAGKLTLTVNPAIVNASLTLTNAATNKLATELGFSNTALTNSIVMTAPVAEINGHFNLSGISQASAFGSAVLGVEGKLVNGVLTPVYFYDANISNATVKSNLAALFAGASNLGAQVDALDKLGVTLPFADVSLLQLMKTSDGRSLGDLLSFSHYKDGSRSNVLTDYLTSAGSNATYSGLLNQIRDYLMGQGVYSTLESMFPTGYANDPLVVNGGGLTTSTGALTFAVNLDLAREFLQQLTFGDELKALGLSFLPGQGVPLVANMTANLSYALSDATSSSSTKTISVSNFTVGVKNASADNSLHADTALGALNAHLDGTLEFDTGTIALSSVNATVDQITAVRYMDILGTNTYVGVIDVSTATPTVRAHADFDVTGNVFGTSFYSIAGNHNPHITMDWGTTPTDRSVDGAAINWSAVKSTTPSLSATNFTNLSALSSLTATNLTGMLADVTTWLNDLRDSGQFDGLLPFTNVSTGTVLDFSQGLTDFYNASLQSPQQSIFASSAISPVLSQNAAFDIQFKRTGDTRATLVTITILASETTSFTHINQLAQLVNQKITAAMNGVLSGKLAADGSSITQTTAAAAQIQVISEGGTSQNGWVSNERQQIDLHASSGTFTLTLDGKTTTALSVTSSAAEIQHALETLDSVGRANVVVTGDARHWMVTFTGALSGQNMATLVANMSGATAGGLVEVSADSQKRDTATGKISGRLVLSQTTYGTFDEFKVSPAAGASVVNVTTGSSTVDAVQRIYVVNGAGGSFTLSGTKADGETAFSAVVNWPSSGTLSSAIQTALNTALGTTGVTVALNQTVVVNQGVQVFDVTFTGTGATHTAFELMEVNSDALQMKPAAQIATLTLAQGSVIGGSVTSEVQRVTFSNISGTNQFSIGFVYGGKTYETNPITYSATAATLATNIQSALRATFQQILGSGYDDAVVTVAAVSGKDGSFDVTFADVLSGINMPQMVVNGSQLAYTVSANAYNNLSALGFNKGGNDQQAYSRLGFNSYQSLIDLFQQSISNQLTSGSFSVNPRYDVATKSMMFDVKLGNNNQTDSASLALPASAGDVSGLSTNTLLDITHSANFTGTIGFDFSKMQAFSLRASGSYYGEMAASQADPKLGIDVGLGLFIPVPASFDLVVDGKSYTGFSVQNSTSSYLEGSALVNALNASLTAKTTTASDPLAVRGFTNLGQAFKFESFTNTAGKQALRFVVQASVGEVKFANVSDSFKTVAAGSLGFATWNTPIYPAPKAVNLTTNGFVASASDTTLTSTTADAEFTLTLDKEVYTLKLLKASTTGNADRAALVADLNTLLTSKAVVASGVMAGKGFANLGDILSFSSDSTTGQLMLLVKTTANAKIDKAELAITAASSNPLSTQLGFSAGTVSVTKGDLASGILSANASFQVVLDNGSPVTVTVARDTGNTSINDLIADINAALTTASISSKVKAALTNNRLELQVVDASVSRLQVLMSNENNTAMRELGLTPTQSAQSASAAMFIQNASISGSYVGQVHGQSDSANTETVTAVVGMLGVNAGQVSITTGDYQGGFSVKLRNGLTDSTITDVRIDFEDIANAALSQVSLLGMGSDFTTTSTKLLTAKPDSASGILDRDVGLTVTITPVATGTPILLDVVVRASDTTSNTTVANLATDIDTAIKAALHAKSPSVTAYDSTTFVTADASGVLSFAAPTSTTLAVAARSLANEYMTTLTPLDATLANATTPKAILTLSSVSVVAPTGMTPPSVSGSVTMTETKVSERLSGQDISNVTVTLPSFGDLDLFKSLTWSDMAVDFSQLSGILGDLASMGAYGELGRDLPVVGTSVNALFDVSTQLTAIQNSLVEATAVALTDIPDLLKTVFGTTTAISLAYDSGSNSLLFNVPWTIAIDQTTQLKQILADEGLMSLLSSSDKTLLSGLLGNLDSISDGDGSALLRMIGSLTFNLAFGIDLAPTVSGGGANTHLGKVYLLDHTKNATSSFTDDTGTYATLTLTASATGMGFDSSVGVTTLRVQGGSASIDVSGGLSLDADNTTAVARTYLTDFSAVTAIATDTTATVIASDASFTLALDGESYTVSIAASDTTANTLRSHLVTDVQNALNAISLNSAIGNKFYQAGAVTKLGDIVKVSTDANGQLMLLMTSNVKTGSISVVNTNTAHSVLGFNSRSFVNNTTTFANNGFDVVFDGTAAVKLPMSLVVSDSLAQLALEELDGFRNPLDLGIMELDWRNLGDSFAKMGGESSKTVINTADASHSTISIQVTQAAVPPAPTGGTAGAGDVTPEGAPVDKDIDSSLSAINVNPYGNLSGGSGTTTPTASNATTTVALTGPSTQPVSTGFDISLIAPDVEYWLTALNNLVAGVTGDGCAVTDITKAKPVNGPLLFLLRDPTIIVNTVDTILENVEKGLDAFTSVLSLPIIGDQLSDALDFVSGLRKDLTKSLQDALASAVGTYGGLDNALRMFMFDALTTDSNSDGIVTSTEILSNPFLNFIRDYNNDGFVTPDDVVVEYLASGKQPGIDPRIANYLGISQTTLIDGSNTNVGQNYDKYGNVQTPNEYKSLTLPSVLPGQRTAWVTSGTNTAYASLTGSGPYTVNLASLPADTCGSFILGFTVDGQDYQTAQINSGDSADKVRQYLINAFTTVDPNVIIDTSKIGVTKATDGSSYTITLTAGILGASVTNPALVLDRTSYIGTAGSVVLDSSFRDIIDDMVGTLNGVAGAIQSLAGMVTTPVVDANNSGSNYDEILTKFADFALAVASGTNTYTYDDLLSDTFGAGVIAASADHVIKNFEVTGAGGATTPRDFMEYNVAQFKADLLARAEQIAAQVAINQSTAVQFRMNLGQTYVPALDLSFDIGVPGLNLSMDGGIQLELNWDLYLGFGVDINDGFYLVTNMPGHAGIGEITNAADAKGYSSTRDFAAEIAHSTTAVDLIDYSQVDGHIANLWLIGKPTFEAAVEELQVSVDVTLKPGTGNTPAKLNGELLVLNATLEDNWDGFIRDNDTGFWGDSNAKFKYGSNAGETVAENTSVALRGDELLGGVSVSDKLIDIINNATSSNLVTQAKALKTSLTGSLTDQKTLSEIIAGSSGALKTSAEALLALVRAEGSRTRLTAHFSIDIKDKGPKLLGIQLPSILSDGRLTYSEFRSSQFKDLVKFEWDAQAQINLHAKLGISLGGSGYLPAILGDFHLYWKDNNQPWYKNVVNDLLTGGYSKLFKENPSIWFSDIELDMGTFFTNFLQPIVKPIQDITDPIMPVIDAITTPIPGLSDIMGRDFSAIDLAVFMSKLFGGDARVDFVVAMVRLLEIIDQLPADAQNYFIPVAKTFILNGAVNRQFNLSALQLPDINLIPPSLLSASVVDPFTLQVMDPYYTSVSLGSIGGTFSSLFENKVSDYLTAHHFTVVSGMIKTAAGTDVGLLSDLVTAFKSNLSLSVAIDLPRLKFKGLNLGELLGITPWTWADKFEWTGVSFSTDWPDLNLPSLTPIDWKALLGLPWFDFTWPTIDWPNVIDVTGGTFTIVPPKIIWPNDIKPSTQLALNDIPAVTWSHPGSAWININLPNITLKIPDIIMPSIDFPDWSFSLPDIDWTFGLDIDVDLPGSVTVTPTQGAQNFMNAMKKPGNALTFPILDDPTGTVLNLLMGKPADLMLFHPQKLQVKVGFRQTFPVYPPLFVGIGGEIKLQADLTIGFDTYGIGQFMNSHNVIDIFEGFYVSDNIRNGVDNPEVTLTTKLYAFAELNGGIIRGGVEGGIKMVGTLDLCDPNKDNKLRPSEIFSAIQDDPLDLVSLNLRGSAYIKAYLDIFAIFDYVTVFEYTFMDITLFEWSHNPCDKQPILASMDGTVLTFHTGSTVGAIDGNAAINKQASDRQYRDVTDGNESYTLTNEGGVKITAILPNGQTYYKSFSGVTQIRGYGGAGNDTLDASAINVPVYFVAGGGNDILKGGSAADVLIGSDTGNATLYGNGGDDKLIARGGTTIMMGGDGTDTYRFIGDWGTAHISDNSSTDAVGANVLDFTAQTKGITLDDLELKAFQTLATGNSVDWMTSTTIDRVKGGTGADVLDFSGREANITATLTGVNQGWVVDSQTGKAQSGLSALGTQATDTRLTHQGFKFENIESVIGTQGSDVFRIQNAAYVTGGLYGDTATGLHHDATTGNENANARNTIDFSEYTSNIKINEENLSSFGAGKNITIRGFHNIFGGSGSDELTGDGRNNLIVGNGGADILSGQAGNDLLVADNFFTYANESTSATGKTVSDYLSLEGAGVAGGHGNDGRTWLWKAKTLENKNISGSGNQTLKGGSGNDVLLGALGNDTFNIGNTGEGNDTIMADLGRLQIDFFFNAALFAETLSGSGADTIYLGSGSNLVLAGGGNDTVSAIDKQSSTNIVLTDNGKVKFRTGTTTVGSTTKLTFAVADGKNHQLEYVEASVSSGGDDAVNLVSGNAIVVGGAGADNIAISAIASTGANWRLVAGDHARIDFDVNGGMTSFKSLDTLATTGGMDTIRIGDGADAVTRNLGSNYIIGGMGSDTIYVSAHMGTSTIVRGQATSQDVIVADNGEITRSTSVASATPNLMLKVLSTQTNLGGNDTVITGNGGKVIVAGYGDDTVNALNGINLVFGDSAQIDYDATANNGTLRSAKSIDIALGGVDTVTLSDGYKVVSGGFGADNVVINATIAASAIGLVRNTSGKLEGVTGIAADSSAGDTKGRTGRYIAGDNAQFTFDATGGLTDMVTLDTIAATGGNDSVRISTGADANTVNLGANYVMGGMGDDTILVSANFDSNGRLIQGEAVSQDVILGDNGDLHRTESTTTNLSTDNVVTNNYMLQVVSSVTDKGGNDTVYTGNGGKTIVGGFGSDTIGALDGVNLVFGDNAQIDYDSVAKNGILRAAMATDLVIGAADTITLREGYKLVNGGIGGDTITINATTTPEATGIATASGYLQGVTGVASVSGVDATEAKGRTGRFVTGDNASFTFDTKGGLTDMVTSDQISATGGADTITLGKKDTTADLGYQVVFGGMAADTITVQSGSVSQDIIFGDNAELKRKVQGYSTIYANSTVMASGGDDVIKTGSGDKIVVGGFGADTIVANTVAASGLVNRSIVLGDSGNLSYDLGGAGKLQKIESTALSNGGNDLVTLGDGDITFVGGYGRDVLSVNSTQTAFRVVAGDNAQFLFSGTATVADQAASLTSALTLDQTSTTGDGDRLTIGQSGSISGEMGKVIALGGMGADTITISGATADAVMVGDNGQVLRASGVTGVLLSVASLLPDQGAGDTLSTTSGSHVIVGGMGGDTILSGKGAGVTFGDSARISYSTAGILQSATSIGIAQGGNDTITLGAGTSTTDGNQVVVGGFGADTIVVQSIKGTAAAPMEREVAGDNASANFDTNGNLTSFSSLDSDASTGGADSITVSISGDNTGVDLTDYNVVAGGMSGDTISVLGATPSSDVVSGDNLDYRRGFDASGVRQHLFAGVTQATSGGDDSIRVGQGDKILFGGAGSDTISSSTVAGDRNIAFGDSGNAIFDATATGALTQLLTTTETVGGNDRLSIGAGTDYVFGGLGNDALTINASDTATRIVVGDNGQVNFDAGVASLVQTTGSDSVDASTVVDTFALPSTGANFVLGGPGLDLGSGGVGSQHRVLPGSGSINLSTKVISVVVLGDNTDLGILYNGTYKSGVSDAIDRAGTDFVVAPSAGGGSGSGGTSGGSTNTITLVTKGTGSVTEDTTNSVSGRIAYPALEGGLASFNPTTNSQQGVYGYLTMGEDGSWAYRLGETAVIGTVDATVNARVQALKNGEVKTEVFTVRTTDGSSTTVTITVNGKTDAPQAATGLVQEDTALTASGSMVDTGTNIRAVYVPITTQTGTYGNFSVTNSGAWSYVLNNAAANVQALKATDTVTDAFTVTTVDGSTATITMSITGKNDVATISGTNTGSVTENNATTTATGSLSVSDADTGDNLVVAQTDANGTYGTFSINANGAWTYTLDNTRLAVQALPAGTQVTDTFTVASADGTDTETVTVTITGSNDVATLSSDSKALTESNAVLSTGGTLSLTDLDTTAATVVAQTDAAGTYGKFNIGTDGAWTYVTNDAVNQLNAGQVVTESFVVATSDGGSANVSVTITGSNDVATISGTNTGSVTENNVTTTATGSLSVSDADTGDNLVVAQTDANGTYGTFSINANGAWTYTLDNTRSGVQALPAGTQVTDTFTVASADGTDTETVTVTITGTDNAPVITGTSSGSVTEDTTLSTQGSLVVTDADAGQSSWQTSTQTSVYGQLALDANGLWTYTLNNTALAVQELNTGDSRTDTYTFYTFDGTAYTVIVSVNGKSEPVAPALTVSTTTAPTSNTTTSASAGSGSANNGGMPVTTPVTNTTANSGSSTGTTGSAQTAVVTSMTGGSTQFFQPVTTPASQPVAPAPSMVGASGTGFNATPVNTALGSGVAGLGLGLGGFATAGAAGVNLGDIAGVTAQDRGRGAVNTGGGQSLGTGRDTAVAPSTGVSTGTGIGSNNANGAGGVRLGDIEGATAKDDKRQQGTTTGTTPAANAPTETASQPQGGVPAQPNNGNAPAAQPVDAQPQTPADVPTQPVGPQSANEANQMDDALALAATVAQMAALSTRPGRILWGAGV